MLFASVIYLPSFSISKKFTQIDVTADTMFQNNKQQPWPAINWSTSAIETL